jgi:hypothetical protein
MIFVELVMTRSPYLCVVASGPGRFAPIRAAHLESPICGGGVKGQSVPHI